MGVIVGRGRIRDGMATFDAAAVSRSGATVGDPTGLRVEADTRPRPN